MIMFELSGKEFASGGTVAAGVYLDRSSSMREFGLASQIELVFENRSGMDLMSMSTGSAESLL
jgi:hypothetical protein